ncbi:MAG: 50S ribosomal protein L32 [Proteobacteria bacterium]|nr:50S ribosomal protein L32 [Pseudomonadota bacterium]
MAVPKFRTSRSKKRMRRSHHHLKPTHFAYHPEVDAPKPFHTLGVSPQNDYDPTTEIIKKIKAAFGKN